MMSDPQSPDATTLAAARDRAPLSRNLDVDVCVVGGGLAGLSVAHELALMGASVAVIERRRVGWNASGNMLGSVLPGFGSPMSDVIERVGLADARALWRLAVDGTERVRAIAQSIPDFSIMDGALEVSTVDVGDRLIARLQMLNGDFGTEAEGWQTERVRDVLRSARYFHAVHYPKAFQLDGRRYVHHLATLAEAAGARIFEDTAVLSIDPGGIRKRVVTPSARLRASQIVLAGNIHLGEALRRLSDTLLPVWRHAVLTTPIAKLDDAIRFSGSVIDSGGIDHYRVVEGDRLSWSSLETTWEAPSPRYGRAIGRRILSTFPQLGPIKIAEAWSGACGHAVHNMPQIGELRRGLWVASGFGGQGLNTTAMAGQLIARGIIEGDQRWRLFSPFELVWAGGRAGRIAGQMFNFWERNAADVAGAFARRREKQLARKVLREARLAEANRQARAAGRLPIASSRKPVRVSPPPPDADGPG